MIVTENIKSEDNLLVIWQDNTNKLRHVIGKLTKTNSYEFQYVKQEMPDLIKKGFKNLIAFPDLEKKYSSDKLFSVFSSRLPDKRRVDIKDILSMYELENYDEFELLKRSGGRLPTDSLEFVEPIYLSDKYIKRQFYIAGTKYYLDKSSFDLLKRNMSLSYRTEPNNSVDENAVQILCQGKVIGYIPSYFSKEVVEAIQIGRKIKINVLHVKPNMEEHFYECVKAELIIE